MALSILNRGSQFVPSSNNNFNKYISGVVMSVNLFAKS